MRILVVCAAGASSTFVAQRLRTAAHAEGLAWHATAGAESSLGVDVDAVDVVLIGPHLAPRAAEFAEMAARHGAALAALPEDIFTDLSGRRTLDLVRTTLGLDAPSER